MTRQQALDLFRSPDLIGIGMAADAAAPPAPPRGRRHLHHRPQHQLHQLLHGVLHLLRLLSPAGARRGVRAVQGGDLPEDPGDHRSGRHGRAHARRPSPGPEDRVVRGPAALDQAALPHSPALLLLARDPEHRRGQRPHAPRHHRPPEGRRPGFHSRRRRRDPRRRRAPPRQPAEVLDPGMGGRASHRAPPGDADHRHHDVRLRRDPRGAREPPRGRSPHPGGDRRVHGLHPVDLPAREHRARPIRSRTKPPPSST